MPNESVNNPRLDREIDQAAFAVFDLIRQFNDPKRQHLLNGYFNPKQSLEQLEAKLCTAETHLDQSLRQFREILTQLKLMREAVNFLLVQTRR